MLKQESTYESRWGFHPVDRETYFKIKKLRYEWFKALRIAAAVRRWNGSPNRDCPTMPEKFEPRNWSDRHGRNPIRHAWIDDLYFWAKPVRETPEIEEFKSTNGRDPIGLEEALRLVDELLG